jgi:hypothetical protein
MPAAKNRFDLAVWLSKYWPLLAVIAAAVALRLWLWQTYTVMICGDTSSWIHLTVYIAQGRWAADPGLRPPAYPIFMYLATLGSPGPHIANVVLLQNAMGIGIAALVYLMVYNATRNPWISLSAGVFDALCMNHATTEMTILSESFASFWIVLMVFLALLCTRTARTPVWLWPLLGLTTAMAGLSRPNNLVFIPAFAVIFALVLRKSRAPAPLALRIAAFVASAAAPVLIWSTLLYINQGYFGVTTSVGYNLTHKVIDFVDLAPPEYEPIRGVLMKWEAPRVDPAVPLDSRVWFAARELIELPIYQSTGDRKLVELSRKLMRLDLALIKAHPILYAQAVAAGWWRSWFPRPFQPVSLSETGDPQSPDQKNVVISSEDILLAGAYWLLLALLPILPIVLLAPRAWLAAKAPAIFGQSNASTRPAEQAPAAPPSGRTAASDAPEKPAHDTLPRSGAFIPLILCVLFLGAFSSALIEYGNGRFPIPYEPLAIAAIAVLAWEIADRFQNQPAR